MRFRLVVYDTDSENKFDSTRRYEYLGDKESIWNLWFMLTEKLNMKHIEVYSLNGMKQEPEKGFNGLCNYNL